MPTYTVQAPDGHTITIEGPAGASHAQVIEMAQKLYQPRPAAPRPHRAIAGEPDLGDAGNAALAGGIGFVHNLPLVGDAAITAGRWANDHLNGRDTSWQQANDEAHQTIESARNLHPVASTVGSVAGAVDTGVLAGGALGAAARAGAPGAEAVQGALALRKGQTAANVARVAAVGGAAGGAQASGEQLAGGHVDQAASAGASGAVTGAITAPLALGAGRVGLAATRRVAAPLSAKTALALSKVFGENAADLQLAWRAHFDATGRPPSMAELANYKQQGVIRGLAKNSTPISDALQTNAERAAAERSATMQSRFSDGSASPADLSNARTAQGDVDYPAARTHTFTVGTSPSTTLGGVSEADHVAGEILPHAGLGRADRVRIQTALQSGTLSGQDAQLLRSGLSESLNRNYSPAVKGYLSDLEGILGGPGNEDASAALSQATEHFAANSQRVEGAQHGAGILGSETPASYAATAQAKPNATDEFAQGMGLGANDKLTAAAATPSSATGLAQRLATDDGLYQKLATTFGVGPANAMRRLGQAESEAARAVAPYSRAPSPEDDKAALKDVGQVAAAVASHGLGWKAYHAAKVFAGLDLPPNVQEKVAQYLSDPKMAQQGINLLARAGKSAQQLRQIALQAAAATGDLSGDAASSSVSESQP